MQYQLRWFLQITVNSGYSTGLVLLRRERFLLQIFPFRLVVLVARGGRDGTLGRRFIDLILVLYALIQSTVHIAGTGGQKYY
jgi:hypothetical protein